MTTNTQKNLSDVIKVKTAFESPFIRIITIQTDDVITASDSFIGEDDPLI